MTEDQLKNLLLWTVSMAADFSVETRIRRMLQAHWEAGDKPRTLVMNIHTWHALVDELDGRMYQNYFWTPLDFVKSAPDPERNTTTFLGLPILIKNFLPTPEVIVGV